MSKAGEATREKIVAKAKALVLSHGFGGTSIDALIEQVGITKGAFFYHFKSKSELARTLIERHAQEEKQILDTFMSRAEKLSRDPLQQLLIFLGLFIEMTESWTESYPGCLYASYCYQEELFDETTYEVVVEGVQDWRRRLAGKIREVIKKYPPKREVDPASLADILITVVEGAMVVEKTLGEPHIVTQQVTHFKTYLELLFSRE